MRVRNAAPSSGDGQPTSGSTGVRGAVQRAGNSECRADSSVHARRTARQVGVRRLRAACRRGAQTGASSWPTNGDANSSVGEDPARLSHLPTITTTTSELDDRMEAKAASAASRYR
jgi:hypothetical protein